MMPTEKACLPAKGRPGTRCFGGARMEIWQIILVVVLVLALVGLFIARANEQKQLRNVQKQLRKK